MCVHIFAAEERSHSTLRCDGCEREREREEKSRRKKERKTELLVKERNRKDERYKKMIFRKKEALRKRK